MNLSETIPQGSWHMWTKANKMNCDKQHANAYHDLKKMQTSGALSKDKEVEQMDTTLKLDRV